MKRLLLIVCCLAPRLAWATTTTLGDCAQATVQAAVNAATAGDTLICPTDTETWASKVTISKSLTILGGGGSGCTLDSGGIPTACQSDITQGFSGDSLFFFNLLRTDTVSIGYFTLRLQHTGSSNGMIDFNVNAAQGYPLPGARAHHILMEGDPTDGSSTCGGRFIVFGGIYGLVDHVRMNSLTSRGCSNISAFTDNTISPANSYHIPQTLGDENAVYMEDCDFNYLDPAFGNGATDNYQGMRWVLRHSTIRNSTIDSHGWDSGPRGTRTFEVYDNVFWAASGMSGIDLFGPRSGTGVDWGNTVKNILPQSASQGFISFFTPRYYGALTPAALGGDADLNIRAPGAYPSGTWGFLPFPGMTTIDDGHGNFVTGSNKIDGNTFADGHMDAAYSRTVTDLVTTSGSKTITSATASFVAGDLRKRIYGTHITAGRNVTDGVCTNGSATITSATANFDSGDVGRLVGGINNAATIPNGTTIASVTNSTTAVMSTTAGSSSCADLLLVDCYLTSITNSTTAVMTCNANASGTGGTLTIGYTDRGYPLADQPGYGSFPSANAGNWPNSASYTAGNYEALDPMYLFLNHWQTVNSSFVVQTDIAPASPGQNYVGLDGGQPYIKHGREWYDDADIAADVFANIPATCTVGAGYWATDKGGNWDTTNGTANDGALYRCTATNTWTLYYTPLTYPHPLQGIAAPTAPQRLRLIRR